MCSNVEEYRWHAVAEKKQFVLHKEEQIAAGIIFSGQDQVKYCVKHFGKQPSSGHKFGGEIMFVFERRVSVPLSKMLIGRLRNRAQSTLHRYFK